jgi:hypothetical protein
MSEINGLLLKKISSVIGLLVLLLPFLGLLQCGICIAASTCEDIIQNNENCILLIKVIDPPFPCTKEGNEFPEGTVTGWDHSCAMVSYPTPPYVMCYEGSSERVVGYAKFIWGGTRWVWHSGGAGIYSRNLDTAPRAEGEEVIYNDKRDPDIFNKFANNYPPGCGLSPEIPKNLGSPCNSDQCCQ